MSVSTGSSLSVTRLTNALGAEVTGIDLREPLSEPIATRLVDLFHEHQVLFFRDQHLDDIQHRDFSRLFGHAEDFPFAPASPEAPEVHEISLDGSRVKHSNADIWHSDATFMAKPPLGSVLRAVQLPPVGGDTLWASAYGAYETLSSHLQRLVDGMTATHDVRHSSTHSRQAEFVAKYPPVSHPVVRTHPMTGRKGLFVNRIFTAKLDGVSDRENEYLLPLLADHFRSPDLHVRFRWTPGAIVVWDNRCTQHYAVADYQELRSMRRVVIQGDRPR